MRIKIFKPLVYIFSIFYFSVGVASGEEASEKKNLFTLKPTQRVFPPAFEKLSKATLVLEDAVGLGINNHLPIHIALEQVELAQFKEREAFRELFPQAMLRWDETSGVVSSKDYVGRKYQVRLQHPLYNGGELRYTWEQAKVNLEIAEENYEKTKEDYIIELTKAYYDYVKALKNFGIQERLLKETEQDLSMAKKEYEAGVSVLVDFLNVQMQYNQAYYSYLSSENSLGLARSNFLQLLNLDETDAANIKMDTELVFKEYNIDLEGCIRLALENRLDLKINALSLKAAEYGEKVARSQRSPRVDLTSVVGKAGEADTHNSLDMGKDWFIGAKVGVPWGTNTLNYSFTKENIAPSLTVFTPTENNIHSLRFNILDNIGSYTEGKRGEITRQQAYSELIKSRQTAATQVREAYFNYQETVLKIKNSLAAKELYQKELTVVKQRRQMNEADTKDIVSARVRVAQEEVNYNAAVVENIIAVAKLNKAIGIKAHFK